MGNSATPSPFNQRRQATKARKKAMRQARLDRDKKMEEWRNLPQDQWTMERRVVNGLGTEDDFEQMRKELDRFGEEKLLTDEALKEIDTLKRQAANMKGRITKARKKRTAAEKMKDPKARAEGIEIADGEIEELGVALANKEQELKRQQAELRKLVDPEKRRRLAWLQRWLKARAA